MGKPSYTPGVFNQSAVVVGSAKPKPPRYVVRPRHIIGGVLTVLGLVLVYLCGYEPRYDRTLVVPTPRTLVFVRHADTEGLVRALAAGFDGADLIAELTPDNQLVIPDSRSNAGRRIEEAVRAVNRRGAILVELKKGTDGSMAIVDQAVETVHRFDANLSVVLASYDPAILRRIKQIDPLVRTAMLVTNSQTDNPSGSWIWRQEFARRFIRKFVDIDMISVDYRVKGRVIDGLIEKGWPTFISGPTSEAEIRQAVARRPYGVISDQPMVVRQIRGE